MALQTRPAKVKLFHWAIALGILFQQLTSLFMSDQGTQYLFPWHQYVGMLMLVTVFFFWMYSYAAYDLGMLFPWSGEGRRKVWGELRTLLRGKLPAAGRQVGLSSLVHGFGLLAASGCALTGWRILELVPPGHAGLASDPTAFTDWALMHKFFGEALWAYLLGHVGFALLHVLKGERVLRGIFWFPRERPQED